jgi:CheY-like chemotaxis protein
MMAGHAAWACSLSIDTLALSPRGGADGWYLLAGEGAGGPVPTPQEFAQLTAAHAQYCVLVVDDDVTIRETVTALLADEGYVVAQAANGMEALACLERQVPQVVLLDMRMPVLDGWGFVDELRKRNLDLKVVAMTATHNARVWAQEIGATSYLGKPFEPDELLDLVEHLCTE